MKRWILRLFYGLLFAVPLMLISYAIAQASDQPQMSDNGTLECPACHEAFYTTWEAGGHGQATNDPAFLKAWQTAGQSKECLDCHVTGYDEETDTWTSGGIACGACHGPISDNHPAEPMPAAWDGKVCSDCHEETFFQWQASGHSRNGMDCTECHDPHGTSLKAENPAELCASCHKERSENFAHTTHSEQGLACTDCHMPELSVTGAEGHAKHDHSFFVSLDACNNCHVYEMHDPVDVHVDTNPTQVPIDAMAAVEALPVSSQPVPVNPAGFTLLAGLVGIAFGIIMAPWIERYTRRNRDQ